MRKKKPSGIGNPPVGKPRPRDAEFAKKAKSTKKIGLGSGVPRAYMGKRAEGRFEGAGRRAGAAVDRGVDRASAAARRGYNAAQGAIDRGVDKVHNAATRAQRKMGRAASRAIGTVKKGERNFTGDLGRSTLDALGVSGYRKPRKGYGASEVRTGRVVGGTAAAAGISAGAHAANYASSKWSEHKKQNRGY